MVENAINNGTWGYNNVQWTGLTWYHRINKAWHLSWEAYALEQKNVLNVTDPAGIIANGGFPFTPANGINFNAPFFAQCADPRQLACTAKAFTTLMYLNYQFSPMDNISFRSEFYNDRQGQRTGTKTRYTTHGIGWGHWFNVWGENSALFRSEIRYEHAYDAPAYDLGTKKDQLMLAADLILLY